MTIEKDWTTKAGLRAVVYILESGGRKRHRCGYVGVPEGNPLFGKDYHDSLPEIQQESVNEATVGKKSPITILTATCGSAGAKQVRRSLDILFDCHGGLTFSGPSKEGYLPGNLWWFGYDCGHYNDGEIEPDPDSHFQRGYQARDLGYCEDECEFLAKQMQDFIKGIGL